MAPRAVPPAAGSTSFSPIPPEEAAVYTLTRLAGQQLLLEQAATCGASLVVAELFYKFHSFTLECLAFLATWYVFDFARDRVTAHVRTLRSGRAR
jgi:hypothetical protein